MNWLVLTVGFHLFAFQKSITMSHRRSEERAGIVKPSSRDLDWYALSTARNHRWQVLDSRLSICFSAKGKPHFTSLFRTTFWSLTCSSKKAGQCVKWCMSSISSRRRSLHFSWSYPDYPHVICREPLRDSKNEIYPCCSLTTLDGPLPNIICMF